MSCFRLDTVGLPSCFLQRWSFIWSVSSVSAKTRSDRRAQSANFVCRDFDVIREIVSANQILH
jgi:hypothetical protein